MYFPVLELLQQAYFKKSRAAFKIIIILNIIFINSNNNNLVQ